VFRLFRQAVRVVAAHDPVLFVAFLWRGSGQAFAVDLQQSKDIELIEAAR